MQPAAALAPLVVVLGPTAAGKSALALRLAAAFPGEIVNSDSVQIYRGFDIGTAKPTPEQRSAVPHHLLDIVEPGEIFSAGEYARRARSVLAAISARRRLPIVVGGAGFYLRALLDGLFPGPARDEPLRARLSAREDRRPGGLHRLLLRMDPASAARIHPHDVQKLIRAVEICLLARQPRSHLFDRGRDALAGFAVIKIGLDPPRTALYERINQRCREMFDAGLGDEIGGLLSSGVSDQAKPFESVGYRQAMLLRRQELTLEEAVALAQQSTRRYAKRQLTWFRREAGVRWWCGFGDESGTQLEVLQSVADFLREFTKFS